MSKLALGSAIGGTGVVAATAVAVATGALDLDRLLGRETPPEAVTEEVTQEPAPAVQAVAKAPSVGFIVSDQQAAPNEPGVGLAGLPQGSDSVPRQTIPGALAIEGADAEGASVATAPAPEPRVETSLPGAPSFDLVRADPGGSTLVAGMGEPGATVAVLVNGARLADTQIGADGRFVIFLDIDASERAQVLSLLQKKSDGEEVASAEEVILAPTPAPTPEPEQTAEAAAEPDPAPEQTVEARSEPEPEQIAEAAPEPETVPEAAPEPEQTEDTAAGPEPDAEREQTAEAAPDPEQTAESAPDPEPTSEQTAESTSAPEPAPEPEQTAEATSEPEQTSEATVESEPTSEPEQTAEATVEPEPTSEPEQTAEATSEPEPTSEPEQTAESAPEPAPDSEPTPEQIAEATAEPEPAPEPEQSIEAASEPEPEPEPEQTAQATSEPEPEQTAQTATSQEPQAPAVLISGPSGIEVMQSAPLAPGDVALDTISYDTAGEVLVAGRGELDSFIRIYLDNAPLTTSRIEEDGRWRVTLPEVDTGTYTLRVDQIDEAGDVTARVESPFLRESAETLAAVAETGPITAITVQPGHTLWAIARDRYGEGIDYVKVYKANSDRIRDPDLIYPGQIFDLPDE